MIPPPSSSRPLAAGFSLVEVTVALGIMGFCLLAIFGLLPVGITSNQNAVATTEAVGVATNILAEARAAAAAAASGTAFEDRLGITSPPAAGTSTLYFSEDGEKQSGAADAKYRAVVTMTADAQNAKLLWVRTVISWPAPADPSKAAGSFSAMTAVMLP